MSATLLALVLVVLAVSGEAGFGCTGVNTKGSLCNPFNNGRLLEGSDDTKGSGLRGN